MNEKYFVIAGNRDQYLNFIKRKSDEFWKSGQTSISYSHFIFADAVNIRGYTNPCGWFIGTWYERKDIRNILAVLLASCTNDIRKTEILYSMYDKVIEYEKR